MNIRQLKEKRAGLIADARTILDAARAASRDLAAEENSRWDALMAEADTLGQQIEREERQAAAESDLQTTGSQAHRPGVEGAPTLPEFRSRTMRQIEDVARLGTLARLLTAPARAGFRRWIEGGLSHETLRAEEFRALQADSDIAGGYLLAPLELLDRVIMALDNAVYIRQWGTVFPVANADSLGAPVLEADPADADWTSELATGSEDSTMSFGRRDLHPHPLAKRIKISRKLLRKVPGAEALVMDRLAYKFGVSWEKAALTGTGSGQPLGVFTASASGISTSRDVSADNTSTAITFDGLINAKYSLKGNYWPGARWLFHRDAVKQIAKLVDGNGQYAWRESTRAGEPDRLLGLPVYMSEYAPNTFTTGLYVGILGDFSYYWIADSIAFEVQRLVELYAETNQVGIIGRWESDGMPVLEEAFARVKLG